MAHQLQEIAAAADAMFPAVPDGFTAVGVGGCRLREGARVRPLAVAQRRPSHPSLAVKGIATQITAFLLVVSMDTSSIGNRCVPAESEVSTMSPPSL